MADVNETTGDAVEADDDVMRGCALCGASIHSSSYRCPDCGGHVGLAWGTALKEHFLFLFVSIMIAVACVSSWSQRYPAGATISKTVMIEAPATPGAPPPAPNAPKKMIESTVEETPTVVEVNGLATIRGSFMLAIALYGIVVALFNVLFRRMIVWPFFLNGVIALEVGLVGISRSMSSVAWELWTKRSDGMGMVEEKLGRWRAVPSAHLLLTLAGGIVLIQLIKGVVGGFAAGAAKSKERAAASSEAAEARRAAREGKKKDGGANGGASETPAP